MCFFFKKKKHSKIRKFSGLKHEKIKQVLQLIPSVVPAPGSGCSILAVCDFLLRPDIK
jgi:DNA-directed RNA polymerase specialized sigma54-like protein